MTVSKDKNVKKNPWNSSLELATERIESEICGWVPIKQDAIDAEEAKVRQRTL